MKWALIFWIASCSGADCPIPTYEVKEFDTPTECIETLKTWQNISPTHRAVCIAGDREQ